MMTQEPRILDLPGHRDTTRRRLSVGDALVFWHIPDGAQVPGGIVVSVTTSCFDLTTRADPLSQLESLPDELLQLVVSHLSTQALKNTTLVSKTLHRHATDLLWQNVCLVDQWKLHTNEETNQLWTERGNGESDEHDDTPIIQRLYILAT